MESRIKDLKFELSASMSLMQRHNSAAFLQLTDLGRPSLPHRIALAASGANYHTPCLCRCSVRLGIDAA